MKVSYSRFKETLDQKNDIERQLAAYREKFGDINAQPQPQQDYQQPTYQQAPRALMQNQSVAAFNDYVARQQVKENVNAVRQFGGFIFCNECCNQSIRCPRRQAQRKAVSKLATGSKWTARP